MVDACAALKLAVETSKKEAEVKKTGEDAIAKDMMENSAFRGLPKQPDGQHATPEGYRMLAESVASEVAGAVGR